MTYGRVLFASHTRAVTGAAVSHLAELVRGEFVETKRRPPHPPFGHLLPKGRRAHATVSLKQLARYAPVKLRLITSR
jgi:hypothetical protein